MGDHCSDLERHIMFKAMPVWPGDSTACPDTVIKDLKKGNLRIKGASLGA